MFLRFFLSVAKVELNKEGVYQSRNKLFLKENQKNKNIT